jgi:ATP-dependent RNA helicase RhlE
VLVFTRTKHGANRLADQLEDDGISTSAIHGNKSQSARTKALADFKKGEVRVLVATDIAARGLDIDQLPHVVNYELPNVPEDYVHRIGRTGRAGKEGEAVSLVCVDEHDFLRDIERLLKRDIPKVVIPGFEPNLSIKAEPISHGRGQRGGGRPQASRQGGDHRRGQRSPSASHARADGQRSHSNPHARDGAQRPHASSHAHPGAQRPHSNPHPRAASQHSQPQARSAAEDHGNSHAPRGEVDGNRRTSHHTGNAQPRFDRYDAPPQPHQPKTHSKPTVTTKPARHHAKREVPALFEGGGKRGD